MAEGSQTGAILKLYSTNLLIENIQISFEDPQEENFSFISPFKMENCTIEILNVDFHFQGKILTYEGSPFGLRMRDVVVDAVGLKQILGITSERSEGKEEGEGVGIEVRNLQVHLFHENAYWGDSNEPLFDLQISQNFIMDNVTFDIELNKSRDEPVIEIQTINFGGSASAPLEIRFSNIVFQSEKFQEKYSTGELIHINEKQCEDLSTCRPVLISVQNLILHKIYSNTTSLLKFTTPTPSTQFTLQNLQITDSLTNTQTLQIQGGQVKIQNFWVTNKISRISQILQVKSFQSFTLGNFVLEDLGFTMLKHVSVVEILATEVGSTTEIEGIQIQATNTSLGSSSTLITAQGFLGTKMIVKDVVLENMS